MGHRLLSSRAARFSAVVAAGLIAAAVVGVVLLVAGSDSNDPPARPASVQGEATAATSTPTLFPTSTPTASPTPAPTETPTPVPTEAPAATSSGGGGYSGGSGSVSALAIPRFGVYSAIEAIGLLPTNELDTPHNPYNTGWYSIYDRPGSGGNAVFSAHVDYYPNIRGPFYNLRSLAAGDLVIVVVDGREIRYSVFRNERYSVYDIPMGYLLWPGNSEEWITLITCGGRFVPYNGSSGPGQYLDRDVVVARRIN